MSKQDKFMEAFNPLYPKLWKFILSISRSNDEARETLSEAVLVAYERYDTLRSDKAFLSFLFSIASRVLYANRKRNSRFIPTDGIEFEDFAAKGLSPEEETDVKILYKTLEQLPEKHKEALVLFELFGFNRKEVAEIQNTTVTNVKLRLYRARKKLESILQREIL